LPKTVGCCWCVLPFCAFLRTHTYVYCTAPVTALPHCIIRAPVYVVTTPPPGFCCTYHWIADWIFTRSVVTRCVLPLRFTWFGSRTAGFARGCATTPFTWIATIRWFTPTCARFFATRGSSGRWILPRTRSRTARCRRLVPLRMPLRYYHRGYRLRYCCVNTVYGCAPAPGLRSSCATHHRTYY